uniref:S100P-binding protein-like n=1 Tax=Pristiophorus japonicus TaxID=55135 RepID=UPI00398E7134
MCSSPCSDQPCTESAESQAGFRHFVQSNTLSEGDANTSVSEDTGHFTSSANASADMQFGLFNTLITFKRSTPLKEASPFYLQRKTILNDIKDLDDSLLELEETEVDGEDPINFTSEEIDRILRESDDDTVDNAVSPVLKFDDANQVDDKTLCECTYISNSLLSLPPPDTSKLSENYLGIDEIQASYLSDDSSADVTVLKVEQEINQSLKSDLHNLSSVPERSDVEKSDLPYLSVDELALINHGLVCADETNHAGSANETDPGDQDKMLVTIPTSSSQNLLKDNNKSTFWEQMISERVSFIKDDEVKENISFPVHIDDKVKDLKTLSSCERDASKQKQSFVESAKMEKQQKCNPTKTAAKRKGTRLNCAFDAEIERQKHLYLQRVSNHVKNGCETPGPMQELLYLMDQVADGEYRKHSSSWQHPSDLTTRNYSRRNVHSFNKPNLFQWANSNGQFCRFRGIPARFQRSPIP